MSLLYSQPLKAATPRNPNTQGRLNVEKNTPPARVAANSVNSIAQMAREADKQKEGVVPLTMSGDVAQESTPKPNSREQRKNLAKKEVGLTLTWEFYDDPGYIAAEKRDSEDTLLKKADLNETYRSGSLRLIEVKDKYPITSIQILSRKRGGGRLSTSGYKTILPPYTKFMLRDVRRSSREKYQLYTTFRSFRINFFDANPEIWAFSGVLLNTENHNWTADFRNLYHAYLRGTQCAKIGAECYITFQDIVVSGLILNMSDDFSANSPNGVPVSFQLLVTNEFVFSTSKLTNVVQRKLYPLAARNQPAMVFELIRKNYARTYGQAEQRAGLLVKGEVKFDKLGEEIAKSRRVQLEKHFEGATISAAGR